MADNLELLWTLKADGSQAQATLKSTESSVNSLRQTFGTNFSAMEQVGTQALRGISNETSNLIRQIPIIGTVMAPVTQMFFDQATASTTLTVANQGAAAATTEFAAAETAADVAGTPLLVTLGALGVAVGAVAAVIGGVVFGAFELAKSTAEAGSKIHDLAQQTGLSTLTLSGLKLAADESKGSIDDLGTMMGRLNRLAEQAVEGNKQAIGTLKQFGLTGKEVQQDSDASLGKIFTRIHDLSSASAQAGASIKLFGRSGADLVPIIDQIDGSLSGGVQKAKDLGQAFTQDAANAADEFGDKLTELEKQVQGLAYSIGNTLIPAFTELFKVIQGESTGSGALSLLGKFFKEIGIEAEEFAEKIFVVIAAIDALPAAIAGLSTGQGLTAFTAKFETELTRIIGEAYAASPDKAKGGKPLGAPDKDKSDASKELDDRLAIIKAGEKKIQDAYEEAKDLEKKNYDTRVDSLAEFAAAEKVIEDQRQVNMLAALQVERGIVDRSDAPELDKAKKLAEIGAREEDVRKEHSKNVQAIEKDQNDKIEAAHKAHVAAMQEIQDIANAGEIASAQALADEGFITFETAEERRQALEAAAIENRRQEFAEELADAKENAELQQQIKDKQAALDAKATADAAENLRKLDAARQKDIDRQKAEEEEIEALHRKAAAEDRADQLRRASKTGVGGFSQGLESGTFGKLTDEMTGAQKGVTSLQDAFQVMGQAAGAAVNGLAQGVGNLVQNMVLMGTAGPHAMQKLVASVLAGVAAQAATQAIMFTAYGLAALTPWGAAIYGPATQWFEAAALMASIAVVSGVAGRAIAGDSFKDQSSTGASTGGSSGSGASAAPGAGTTTTQPSITEPRFGGRGVILKTDEQSVNHTVVIHAPPGWVANEFAQDWVLNGKTRIIVNTDGTGATS